MVQDWLRASFGLWLLSSEMTMVIALRGATLAAGGPAASAELQRMITEKIAAGFALQARAWRGQLGASAPAVVDRTARYYHTRVRANRRRLMKL